MQCERSDVESGAVDIGALSLVAGVGCGGLAQKQEIGACTLQLP
jgi:hypothetical protein